MSYRTTEQADEDIVGIYLQGERLFGVTQAERYQDGLFRTFALLASQPNMARLRNEFTLPVRLYPYGAHVVVYTATGDHILIVRVLHGRQDWLARLSQ